MRPLPILAASCFVSSMSMRIVDPAVPDIARDLSVSAVSVALLASAVAGILMATTGLATAAGLKARTPLIT
jgi:predicted MFS family arabinose efflux permease